MVTIRAELPAADELEQPVGLVGRVDQQQFARGRASQQVCVVIEGTHGDFCHGEAGQLPDIGRAADGDVS